MRVLLALALLAALEVPGEVGAEESYLVIIAGISGEPAYRERFHEWSMTMRDAALTKSGLASDRVFYLAEDPEMAPEAIHARSTKENVVALFGELKKSVRPGDGLFVLLVGHGSYDSETARFNLPGRDLTAEEFAALLEPFSEQQVVFVNTSSASGGFLAALSKKDRVVVTATKSGFERNETQFGKYFVEAYSGEGDTDKNERVSVLEAFDYARLKVDGYYQENNLLKTEHAQLDDDGDGQGVAERGDAEGADGADGRMAGTFYLEGAQAAPGMPSAEELSANPELRALVEKKQDLEARVEALRLQKETMPEDLYLQELERLLLELAATTQQIEERAKK